MRVLQRLGHEVLFDSRQTCCGQALFNAGFRLEARQLAIRFISLFRDADVVVAPSGSCVSMVVNHYEELDLPRNYYQDWVELKDRIHEFCSFLVDQLKTEDVGASFPYRIILHNSCHLTRNLGIKDQPYQLLKAVKNLQLVDCDWEDECCGFGGVFSVKYPELSRKIADRRATVYSQANAQYVTGADDSCLHHLRGAFRRLNLPQKTIHIARILASDGEAPS